MSLPLQKAKYPARATGHITFGTSSKGNHQIAVSVVVMDGDHAGEEIVWLGSFTELTSDRTIESLQHMGWEGDDLFDLDGADAAAVLPAEVEIACEPDTYEGETHLKVRWINKPGAGRFAFKEPLTGAGLKAFAAQMRGTIRGARGANGAAKPRRQEPHPNAPAGVGDDPF